MSDIEGKAATGSGERLGREASFNRHEYVGCAAAHRTLVAR
jgi:hypothetical protein